MTVRHILQEKGNEVITLTPDLSVGEAVEALAKHRIGALVVTNGAGVIKGIISERDVVRRLAEDGPACLKKKVAEVMTVNVKVCSEDHTVNDVMEIMTNGRFRHLPVERDGRLIGVISIGDVVKRRSADVQREADEIRTYIASA